jgi:hypothetical protein
MISDDASPARPTRKPRAATTRGARKTYQEAALKQGRGFTPDKQAEYLAALARGMRKGEAAAAVELNVATINTYRKKDPAFAAAEVEAETQASEVIESALWELARGGHLTAIMFWLQNRAPSRWQDMRRVQKTVTHEGTVTHELEAGAAMQRIAALQATLQERAALRSGLELGPPVTDAEVVED